MSFFRVALRSSALARPRLATAVAPSRAWLAPRAAYSAAAGLSKEDITTRVLDVLKGFEKVDPAKVNVICNFRHSYTQSLPAIYVVLVYQRLGSGQLGRG